MRPIYRVLALAVMVLALGALSAWHPARRAPQHDAMAATESCPLPSEDRVALVPVAEEEHEPTLAPPGPTEGDLRPEVVVVQVEGDLPAPGETLSPITPTPDPQNEPTLAPPEPVSGGASPQMILVRVEAEQAAEEDLPADEGPRERPRVGGS